MSSEFRVYDHHLLFNWDGELIKLLEQEELLEAYND